MHGLNSGLRLAAPSPAALQPWVATTFPSLQENLANSIVEGLACGIPVVAFDIGGNKDMIDHMENGYLAKAKNSEDMSNGIKWVIENKNYFKLSENARKKVINIF